MTLLIIFIYMFILIYLSLPEMDLEESQSCPNPHIPPTSENFGIFVNPALVAMYDANFMIGIILLFKIK